MRTTALALMAALFAGLNTGRCPAQTKTAGRFSDNRIVETEYALYILVDESLLHFKDARKLFLQENPRKAAREIRKAAAFMSLYAELATEKGKRALIASIRELDHLGDQVERGTVKSVNQLDDALPESNRPLTATCRRRSLR